MVKSIPSKLLPLTRDYSPDNFSSDWLVYGPRDLRNDALEEIRCASHSREVQTNTRKQTSNMRRRAGEYGLL